MGQVIQFVSKGQQKLNEATEEYPGLRPTHDRFCDECNDFIRIDLPDCQKAGHTTRTLDAEGQMAATIEMMWRYS